MSDGSRCGSSPAVRSALAGRHALVALALATGCTAHAGVADRSWRELRTDRFVLVTDVDEETARERILEMDRLGAALADIYAALLERPPARPHPVRRLHLADCAEVKARFGEDVAGAVIHSADFGGERIIVTCELAGPRNEVALHELTHDLNHRHLADLPAWLEEGLATYYQTLRIDSDRVVVGQRPQMDRSFWQGTARLPSLSELLALSQEELVALPGRRGHFAAWKLTHLLANGSPEYSRRFRAMLAGFGKVERKGDAFAAAFGELQPELTRAYGPYHLSRETKTWIFPYRAADAGKVRGERVMRKGEALALQIELGRPGDRAARDRGMRADLAALEGADPDWTGRLYWQAVVAARTREPDKALELLRRYVAAEPDDAAGWFAIVTMELDRLVPAGHLGVEPVVPAGLDELADEIRELVRHASAPHQLNEIAWFYALRNEPKIGFNFAMRALQVEPGFADCWDTLALLYHRLGRPTEAVQAQRRAIALMAESRRGVSSNVRARLRHYERTAAAR